MSTVVVIIWLPVVLAYQTWTYYVFRPRVSKAEFQPPAPPAAAAAGTTACRPLGRSGEPMRKRKTIGQEDRDV